MTKIKVLAVDDEPLALQQLVNCIKRVSFLELAGTCKNVEEVRRKIEEVKVDALFLDVHMPQETGLQLLTSLQAPLLTVLTTGHPEHALEAFKLNVVDYLLKPFSQDEFNRSAFKLKKQFDLVSFAQAADPSNELLFIKTEYKVVKIEINKIRYIESMGSYLRFYVRGMIRPVMTLLSMRKIENRLPKDRFMRIHRSYIVNLREVQEVSRNHVVLDELISIPVGEFYHDAFQSYIKKYYLGR